MSQANPSDEEVEIYAIQWLGNGNKIKKAWKVAFPTSNATEKSKDEKASRFHNLDKVKSRILALSNIAAQKADEVYGTTAETLLGEYEECRVAAMEERQIGAAVSSVTGKVKLCGFDLQRLEVTGGNGGPILTATPDQYKKAQKMIEDDFT